MFKLAWRNLMHERTRLAISVGGVALAVLLILVMAGVFAGSEEHAVAYIKNQPAPLWLMQQGVENLHMSSSILPPETVRQARQVEGVAETVGLLYAGGSVDMGETQVASYIFAVDGAAPFGGPWRLVEGTGDLGLDEVVLDRDLAARYGLGLGDTVNLMGYELTIAGLSQGTFGIATSITFVNKQALAALMGVSPQAASYVLVQTEPDANVEQVAASVRAAVPDANLLTQAAFIASDQAMIRQMGTDIIRAMSGVAYMVGLLVIALTVYTATVERAHEYGVLKAIGANTGDLLRVVLAQASISTGLGYVAGVGLSYGVAALVGRLFPEMLILIEPGLWLRQLPVLAVITTLAALLPLGRISRLDPMVVFRA
ncbi:MAG TPA: FtsX-like permease family protein [Chloroflexota bacterium]|nr:FtsX-like permease family protein [Chloroflexota bacterium]HUM67256.1 FtsX-like permease family protein [Chloroflexota bacterium]